MTDQAGRQTGNPGSGNDLFNIPNSTYLHDGLLEDDADGGLATADTTTKKGVYISNPTSGIYSVAVSGSALGTYTLRYIALASDHTAQINSVPGIANMGSVARYNIEFSPTPGSAASLNVLATYSSTLADINNALALSLIDNAGIASALSSKINAASDAATRGDSTTASNVLNAFKNQVSAQTRKQITGVAPQVLLEDADSLISQLP